MNWQRLAVGATLGVCAVLVRVALAGGASNDGFYFLSTAAPLFSATTVTNFPGGFSRAKFDLRDATTNQSLFISAEALLARTNYVVRVQRRGDTNLMDAATITSDKSGRAQVTFEQRATGTLPKKSMPLPDVMDPVSDIVLVQVFFSTQSVFRADFSARTKLNYLVQRSFHNEGIEIGASADLSFRTKYLQADLTRRKTNVVTQIIDENRFDIRGSALTPNMPYFLALNGILAMNVVTDAQGAFQVQLSTPAGELALPTLPNGSAHVEDFLDIAIVDANTNIVLITTLP